MRTLYQAELHPVKYSGRLITKPSAHGKRKLREKLRYLNRGTRARTEDLLIPDQTLYLLSYTPYNGGGRKNRTSLQRSSTVSNRSRAPARRPPKKRSAEESNPTLLAAGHRFPNGVGYQPGMHSTKNGKRRTRTQPLAGPPGFEPGPAPWLVHLPQSTAGGRPDLQTLARSDCVQSSAGRPSGSPAKNPMTK